VLFQHSGTPKKKKRPFASFATKRLDKRGITQHCPHAIRQGIGISGWATKPRFVKNLAETTRVRRDHKLTSHHLFDGSKPRCFLPNRRHYNHADVT
jgi:hypothetical protein